MYLPSSIGVHLVVALVEDERWHTDVRQDVANVHLEHHPHQRDGGTGLTESRSSLAYQSS